MVEMSALIVEVEKTPVDDPYHPPKSIRQPLDMGPMTGEVYHFAVWRLRNGMKESGGKALAESTKAMRAIPGVTGVHFGPGSSMPSLETEAVDYAMLETFTSMKAAMDYLPHPRHHATIDLSRSITEQGMAIYFMPLEDFASMPAHSLAAGIQVASLWLPEATAPRDIEALNAAVKELRDIPGLLDVKFGPRSPIAWIGPDDSFDCAIALAFDTPENATSATAHKAHIGLRNTMGRIAQRHRWYAFAPAKE